MKIMKTFWDRRNDGRWQIAAMKGLDLKGPNATDDLFAVQEDIVLNQATPSVGIPFLSIGTIRSYLGESIVPIVANVHGESTLRCVGTGFFVSCSGLLITAAHVITDPIERDYGDVAEYDDITWQMRKLNFGVLIPTNPVFQQRGFTFFPFEWTMFLAEKLPHPIPFMGVNLNSIRILQSVRFLLAQMEGRISHLLSCKVELRERAWLLALL